MQSALNTPDLYWLPGSASRSQGHCDFQITEKQIQELKRIHQNGCENKWQQTWHVSAEECSVCRRIALWLLYLLYVSKFQKLSNVHRCETDKSCAQGCSHLHLWKVVLHRVSGANDTHWRSRRFLSEAETASLSMAVTAALRLSITRRGGTEAYQTRAEASTQKTSDKKEEEVKLVMDHIGEKVSL